MRDMYQVPEPYQGYIVTLNTLARSFPDTREDIRNYSEHIQQTAENPDYDADKLVDSALSHHLQAHVTYGDFDRVTFNGVDRFPRFYDLDQRSKYWLGKHQCVFLYHINYGKKPRLFPYQGNSGNAIDNDFGFCISDKAGTVIHSALKGHIMDEHNEILKEGQIYPFFLLSQISFSNDILTRVKNFSEFIKAVRLQIIDKLDKIIDEEHLEVHFEVFGCLNTSELSILWLARQYTDVFYMIDILKGTKFSIRINNEIEFYDMFLSFYSVLGRTLTNKLWSFGCINDDVEKCLGMAQVDITISNDKSLKEFYKLLIEDLGTNVVVNGIKFGEHDLSIIVPFKTIYNANCEMVRNIKETSENGLFRNEKIKDYILGIKVTPLSQEIKEDNYEKKAFVFQFDESIVNNGKGLIKQLNKLTKELRISKDENDKKADERIRAMYMDIRAELKSKFNSHTGAVDTLDMLFTDYLSNIHASYNALWRNDYHYQFKKSLEYLRFILIKPNRDFWDLYTQTINNIRQQTEHFSQSGRLVMQIPASHLRYTASCDMMFHSYYGETKVILEDVYRKQGKGLIDFHQSELLPIITTNSTPVFKGKLYVAGNNCHDLRILQIDIPYSLLFDPIVGFPYLIHELFHFITPSDRVDRNKQLFRIAVNEALSYMYVIRFTTLFFNYYLEMEYYEKASEHTFADESPEFTKYMGVATDNKTNRPDLIKALKNNIALFMLKDEVISAIREEIVNRIVQKGQKDFNHASWHKASKLFEETINNLSVDELDRISLSILEGMRVIDKYKNENNFAKLYKLFHEGKYIGIAIENESVEKSNDDDSIAIKRIEDYLYSNRMSIFSTYDMYINSHAGNSRILKLLDDHFFRGIREAIPDYAMVKYCKMNEIEYLICYTRNLRINNKIIDKYEKQTIAQQEILRLYSVLIWMSETRLYENGGFKKFEFEKNSEQFIKEYVADHISQKFEKEKFLRYVAEAIYYFCRYCSGLQAYKRDYGIYYDYIEAYGKNYDIYFQNGGSSDDTSLKPLIDIVCKQRDNKKNREKFIKKSSWTSILKLSKKIIKEYNGEYMPDFHKIEKSLYKLELINPNKSDYATKMSEYNKRSFENELQFVQTSIRQKTFKMIADKKEEWRKSQKEKEEDKRNEKGDDLGSASIEDIINQYTTYRIWDMQQLFDVIDWIRNNIGGNPGKTNIWYCVKKKGTKLLPSALNREKEPQIDENHKSILRNIQDDLHNYYQDKGSILRKFNGHEIIAKMTLDDPLKNSNLIAFKRSLIDCMDDEAFDENSNDTSIYLFSDRKYLEARRQLFENSDFMRSKRESHEIFINTPLVLGNRSEDNTLEKYIITNNTEKSVVNYEKKLQLPLNLDFTEKIELLPMTLSFTNLDRDEYFLAYDLRTPNSLKGGSKEVSLDNIQLMYFEDKFKKNKGKNRKKMTRDNAFLYRIDIGYDTIRQLKSLKL